jgi:signal transduction histidine kinase
MDHIGDLSRDLRPNILDDFGLVPSLKSMLDTIRKKSRIGCHLFTKNIPGHISTDKALTVYRIVQEALRNSLRHAHAENIYVNLTIKDHCILLTIEDDGTGFEYDGIEDKGNRKDKLGIMIMNERAVQANGEFRVESGIGKGTQVIAEIPIE